jgi:hypothetical protein
MAENDGQGPVVAVAQDGSQISITNQLAIGGLGDEELPGLEGANGRFFAGFSAISAGGSPDATISSSQARWQNGPQAEIGE